jgi:hypothetical protein
MLRQSGMRQTVLGGLVPESHGPCLSRQHIQSLFFLALLSCLPRKMMG